ncbi:MAG: hypothetical protein K5744_09065 [Eubacterium sp.]|jgi:hypothetical protein|nr:hypothetical protein [Eubacterium sp.]
MASLKNYEFVELKAVTLSDDDMINNAWKNNYISQRGLVVFFRSEHKDPGMYFIRFYPLVEDGEKQVCIRTTTGKMRKSKNLLSLRTENSMYEFEIKPDDFTDAEKRNLKYLV